MGAVYRAWDTRLSIPIALKEMIPQPGLDPHTLAQLRQQFQQEAVVLARLSHPHLVRVTDFFEEGSNVYLVMNFVEGENLAQCIEREGALPEAQVLEWADQLLDALAYCHAQGVIHRDVKPQNIRVRPDGRVVLVDFGLVKLWDPRDPRTRTAMRGLGTPEYAPPEQYDAATGHTDPRSDLYGLGATLYHALTGQVPPTATQRIASRGVFQQPRALNQHISPANEAAVLRAMELTMEDRFPTAQEMRAALGSGTPPPARLAVVPQRQPTKVMPGVQPAALPRKRVPGWVWAVGGLGVLALGVVVVSTLIVGLLVGRGGQPETGATPTAVVAVDKATSTPRSITVSTPSPLPSLAPRHVPPQCEYNVYRMGWVLDYSDAENILNVVFHPDSPFQYTFWDHYDFHDLVDQALVETDSTARVALWQQAEDILVTDYAAVIPIFHYDRTSLVRPELETEFPPFGAPHLMKWRLPRGQDSLRVRLATEPPTLDVNTATDTTSHYVLNQLMEGLYRYAGEGTIEPAGAKSYEVSKDGTVYTIHLRENAVWSDAQRVVAQHYVDGIIRLLDPETAAEYAWLMYPIQGAEPYNIGDTDDPSTVGVRAVDDRTLEITLEQPASHFDSILAFFTTYPVRLDVIEEYGELWTEPGNFVGNGPYVLAEWAHDDHLMIKKNPIYHEAFSVTIERVEFPIIVEDATSLAAYERGELDVSGYPNEELPYILDEMEKHLVRLPWPGVYYLGLNAGLEPTSNSNFRKALASSINKRAILDAVLNMPWRINACGVIPPEIPGYGGCGSVGYPFDVETAQRHLDMAMEEMDVGDPDDITVTLWFNRGNEDIIEAVVEQWETNLGINVNVINMEWGAYLETLGECSGDQ